MSSRLLQSNSCLGFVGLGSIGLPIAANLIERGFKLKVHTKSRLNENDKRLKGAKPCSNPQEAAEGCKALLLCVSDEDAVEEVLFGSGGASQSLKEGAFVIDFLVA